MSTAAAIPRAFERLVDDAAIFPPGNAALARAVEEHRGHLSSPYAGVLGPFVVDDRRLPELLGTVPVEQPLAVTVVVTGGAGGVEPVLRWCEDPRVELRGVEVALRDPDALAANARRVATVAPDGSGGVATYVELPRVVGEPTHGWLRALDEVASAGLGLKLRTGGEAAELFPTCHELARSIDAALDRETPFKCTAGLHQASNHVDRQTGFDHHGFLNVLLATAAAWDGGSVDDVAGVLADRRVAEQAVAVGPERLGSARRWFASFGCCGVLDPVRDLVELGLLPADALPARQ